MAWDDFNNNAIGVIGLHIANTSLASAVTLTQPANAKRILIQAFAQNVRFIFAETTNTTLVPTATLGFRLLAGERLDLSISSQSILKVIEEAASASIQYQWVV